MFDNPAVAITFIVSVAFISLAAIAGVVVLLALGKDAAAIGLVVGGPVAGLLAYVATSLRQVKKAVAQTPSPPQE